MALQSVSGMATAAHAHMEGGRWVSDDRRWWWDGAQWQPLYPPQPPAPIVNDGWLRSGFIAEKEKLVGKDGALLLLACYGNDMISAQHLLRRRRFHTALDVNLGAPETPLLLAVTYADRALVELLLASGANIAPDDFVESLRAERLDLAQLLVDRGLPVTQATEALAKFDSAHLLLVAIKRNDAGAVRFLVRCGAEISTPVICAATRGQEAMLDDLLAGGADIDKPDRQRQTALHRMSAAGDVRAVEILLSKGADRAAIDDAHRTPLERALEWGRHDVAKVLLPAGTVIEPCAEGRHEFGEYMPIAAGLHRHGCFKCGFEVKGPHVRVAGKYCDVWPDCNDRCWAASCEVCGVEM